MKTMYRPKFQLAVLSSSFVQDQQAALADLAKLLLPRFCHSVSPWGNHHLQVKRELGLWKLLFGPLRLSVGLASAQLGLPPDTQNPTQYARQRGLLHSVVMGVSYTLHS